ncbi:hypothetical protein [Campylobacter sp. RM16187]|uniref:hypothetical protein n=1 Tax=Campylobacter sp. RM16187 TaxID=1660063 RepID=UPI0021B629AD|nr:hypothetical protein [Campylobacter sp. RM16187]QKG30290.1 hypothetical protein CDOMF_a041 [Campylobacter sp. RM16187]
MQLIGRYVFENFEIGDEIKSKMDLIEKSKLSYDEFKKYEYAKTKFLQERFNQNLSDKQKNIILNKHIHETLTAFNAILENNQLNSFFQFMTDLEQFKDDPTPDKAEQIKTNIQTLKELNLSSEQSEFLSQVEQLDFDEVLTNPKRMR